MLISSLLTHITACSSILAQELASPWYHEGLPTISFKWPLDLGFYRYLSKGSHQEVITKYTMYDRVPRVTQAVHGDRKCVTLTLPLRLRLSMSRKTRKATLETRGDTSKGCDVDDAQADNDRLGCIALNSYVPLLVPRFSCLSSAVHLTGFPHQLLLCPHSVSDHLSSNSTPVSYTHL